MGLINAKRQAYETTTLAGQLDEMRKQLEELNARATSSRRYAAASRRSGVV